ncbi:MAG: MFS transporter [Pseudomonadota bacterium]
MARSEITTRDWLLLVMVALTVGLIALNETAIGLALPAMRQDLAMSAPQSHWAVNAYLLVFAACIAGAGKLGDVVGLKPLYLMGVVVFALGSAACGWAASADYIIAARAIQGLGAAAIYPAALAISSLIFPPEREGHALGIFSVIGAAFLVLGPLAGGLLTQGLSWRWIFWINLPAAAIAIPVVLLCHFAEARKDAKPRFDFAGLVLLIVGLGALVIGTMQGSDWGWSSAGTVFSLAIGVIALAMFAVVELRMTQPLIRVALFAGGAFAFANAAVYLGMFQRMVVAVFGALFLQDVLGYDPIDAGLALLPAMIPVALLATYGGRLSDRLDPVAITRAGMAATGLCLAWVALAVALRNYLVMLPALVLWGAVMTLIMAPPRRIIMAIAGRDQRGEASGISLATQLLGATTGVAVASALLNATSTYWIIFAVTAALTLVVSALGLMVRGAGQTK